MKNKSILIAAGIAVVLFIYGYTLSTVGHDHSSHSAQEPASPGPTHDHADHDHH